MIKILHNFVTITKHFVFVVRIMSKVAAISADVVSVHPDGSMTFSGNVKVEFAPSQEPVPAALDWVPDYPDEFYLNPEYDADQALYEGQFWDGDLQTPEFGCGATEEEVARFLMAQEGEMVPSPQVS